MIENQPISCIKDGLTGECRPIKDKTARELIEQLNTRIDNLVLQAGAVTREELEAVQQDIRNINQAINSLDNNYATDSDIKTLQDKINEIISALNSLDNTYATDEDIQRLQSAIDLVNDSLALLDKTYATDSDLTALSNSIDEELTKLSNYKQDNLTAGEGIKIENNVISKENLNVTRLYNGNTIASSDITVTLEGKISDYKELIFVQCYGESMFSTYAIPVEVFNLMTGNNGYLCYTYGDNSITRYVIYNYVDDTHIKINAPINAKFFTVYGVK